MTSALAIAPTVFYDAADALHTAAADFFSGVDGHWQALTAGAHMAGTYSEATKWADSYDQHAADALDLATTLAGAMDSYADVLRNLGYNHAAAEHASIYGIDSPPPPPPPAPTPAVYLCRVPLPSAGGPSNGLDDAVALAEKVGITVPNGDTAKLAAVADVWTQLQTLPAVAGLAGELDRITGLFDEIASPELDFIESDLRKLKASADAVPAVFTTLATACRDHSTSLGALRDDLKAKLEELGRELLKEVAITAAIGIAASLITFGIGAAVASARVVEIAARFARPIRLIIDAWKGKKKLEAGIKLEQDIAGHTQDLRAITRLGDNVRAAATADSKLTAADRQVLLQGPSDTRGTSLTRVLRGDVPPTAEQQRQIDALNEALGKLPAHEGPVMRHTNLTPEELARYEPGKTTTELGFTSSSTNPAGVNELTVLNSDVEFQILSKTGRNYSQYGTPDEVLFPSGTDFFVRSKIFDPATGRTVIKMVER
ncbi:hypothetical protein [Nocardia sp. NBC_00511]|uniref:hypothetical protein n=1 Tax=Nocardia sp. NBC_00511 TaxID=2903591 RepID=UPI0030E3F42B